MAKANTDALRTLTVAINANTKALEKGLQQAEKDVEKFANNTNKKTTSVFSGMGKSLSGNTKIFAKFTKNIGHANTHLAYFGRVLKRVMLYRAVRQVIASITNGLKEGITNLEAYSEKMGTAFNPNLDRIKESLLFVKNATGAMIAPIINYLTPAVVALADAFANMANQVGLFIAKLTGQSQFSAAIKGFQDADKAAGSLKKTLFGFDELNIFNAPNGSSAEDYGAYFTEWETMPNSFVDLIKKQNWKGLGEELAKKLNEAIGNLNVEEAGEKIKSWIKNAIDFAIGFVHEFDFGQVGNRALEFAAALFDPETAWEFGDLAASMLTGLADAVLGLFTAPESDEKWKDIGESIRACIVGACTRIQTWFAEKDWDVLMQNIEDSVEGFFTGLDLPRTADAVVKAITTSIEALIKVSTSMFTGAAKGLWGNMDTSVEKESNPDGDGVTHKTNIGNAFAALVDAGFWAGIGYLVAGPMGAIAGGTIATFVDAIKDQQNIKAVEDAFTWLFSVVSFAAIGNAIGGPKGALIGALFGGAVYAAQNGDTTIDQDTPSYIRGDDNPLVENYYNNEKDALAGAFSEIKNKNKNYQNTYFTSSGQPKTGSWDDVPAQDYTFLRTYEELKKKSKSRNSSIIPIGSNASGGFVDTGEMFIAREAGPELVGTIGNRTAVANNDQIVEGIANGVASAMDNTNSVIMQMANAVVNAIANKEINTQVISDRDIYRASERGKTLTGATVIS